LYAEAAPIVSMPTMTPALSNDRQMNRATVAIRIGHIDLKILLKTYVTVGQCCDISASDDDLLMRTLTRRVASADLSEDR
jgi:hypothetical protein